MAGVTENHCKFELCAVVRFFQAEGVSQVRSASVYGQKVLSRKKVSVWRNRFKDGRTALNDDPEKNIYYYNLRGRRQSQQYFFLRMLFL
jgi:hypothetical protein